MATALLLLFDLWASICQGQQWRQMILALALLGLIYALARYIPSAFLQGKQYLAVQYYLKFSRLSLIKQDWQELLEIFRLAGVWWLLSYFLLTSFIRKIRELCNNKIPKISFAELLFLVSIFIPLLSIENISRWDAVHKFAIMVILAGFVFLIDLLKQKEISKNLFFVFFGLNILITLPNLYDYINHRLVSSKHSFTKAPAITRNQDLIAYFHSLTSPIKGYPVYQVGGSEIATLASFGGHYVANAFYPGFLVNIRPVDWPTSEHWATAKSFYDYIEADDLPSFIVVERGKNQQFLQLLKRFEASPYKVKVDIKHPRVFRHYVLYQVNN